MIRKSRLPQFVLSVIPILAFSLHAQAHIPTRCENLLNPNLLNPKEKQIQKRIREAKSWSPEYKFWLEKMHILKKELSIYTKDLDEKTQVDEDLLEHNFNLVFAELEEAKLQAYETLKTQLTQNGYTFEHFGKTEEQNQYYRLIKKVAGLLKRLNLNPHSKDLENHGMLQALSGIHDDSSETNQQAFKQAIQKVAHLHSTKQTLTDIPEDLMNEHFEVQVIPNSNIIKAIQQNLHATVLVSPESDLRSLDKSFNGAFIESIVQNTICLNSDVLFNLDIAAPNTLTHEAGHAFFARLRQNGINKEYLYPFLFKVWQTEPNQSLSTIYPSQFSSEEFFNFRKNPQFFKENYRGFSSMLKFTQEVIPNALKTIKLLKPNQYKIENLLNYSTLIMPVETSKGLVNMRIIIIRQKAMTHEQLIQQAQIQLQAAESYFQRGSEIDEQLFYYLVRDSMKK